MTNATRSATQYVYGDIQCLNCGRTLAAAVKRIRDGATSVRPLRAGVPLLVEWQPTRGLRCKPCGGRAFIEYEEIGARVVQSTASTSDVDSDLMVA